MITGGLGCSTGSSLNSGAPDDSIHCMKNGCRLCPDSASHALRKSSVLIDFQANLSGTVFRIFLNASSPTTPRSMWITVAPLPAVAAQNSGE